MRTGIIEIAPTDKPAITLMIPRTSIVGDNNSKRIKIGKVNEPRLPYLGLSIIRRYLLMLWRMPMCQRFLQLRKSRKFSGACVQQMADGMQSILQGMPCSMQKALNFMASSMSSPMASEEYPPASMTTFFLNRPNAPEMMALPLILLKKNLAEAKVRSYSTTWSAAMSGQLLHWDFKVILQIILKLHKNLFPDTTVAYDIQCIIKPHVREYVFIVFTPQYYDLVILRF